MTLYRYNEHFTNILTNNKSVKVLECSSDKTHWQRLGIDEALAFAWIRINNSQCFNFLIIDIDEKNYNNNSVNKIINNIQPNYVIYSPIKEKSLQIGYILKEPIFLNNPKEKERVKNCINTLNDIAEADKNNKNYKAKNPICGFWFTEWHRFEAYSLNEIEYLTRIFNTSQEIENSQFKEIQKTQKHKNYVYDFNSSNCQNFDDLRLKAYEFYDLFNDTFNNQKEFKIHFFNFLKKQANPKIYKHQTVAEIDATIRSIIDFCLTKYKKSNKYTRINAEKKRLKMEKLNYIKEYFNYKIPTTTKKQDREFLAEKLCLTQKTINTYITICRKETTVINDIAKEVIKLREQNNLKFFEIAKILDKKEDTIRKIYYRNRTLN